MGETKDKIIYDLYSGTGTIAQMLAPVAKHVIGVEIIEEAVEAARENAEETAFPTANSWQVMSLRCWIPSKKSQI